MTLTVKQKIEYMHEPDICPFCKNNDLLGEQFEVGDDERVLQVISCSECNEAWTDVYKLVDVE